MKKRLGLLVGLIVFATCLIQTKTIHNSWNESSRLAAIQSLVERGTWRIDASPYAHETGDRIVLDGHYYSDKPPLLTAIGAGVYGLLYYGLRARLASEGCQPGTICVYYWLTVLLVGLPAAVMMALFYRLVNEWQSGWVASALTILLFFGTAVWPYSLVFNAHVPAAAAVFAAFYLLLKPPPSRWGLFIAGGLTGLAVMFDMLALFLGLALFAIAVLSHQKRAGWFVAGGLLPGLITIGLNYQIGGTFLMPYFLTSGYDYPGAPFPATAGGVQGPDDGAGRYTFRYLVGDRGWLAYFPVLGIALAGLSFAGRQKVALAVPVGLALLAHLAFVMTQTNNFGGDAYGNRHLIVLIPVLFFFSLFVFPLRQRWWWLLAGLACLSFFGAYRGVRATWQQLEPPLYLNLQPMSVAAKFILPATEPHQPEDQARRSFELPPISEPLGINVNHTLMLQGYDLPLRRIEPGQPVELTLYWQLLQVARGDYVAFIHLVTQDQNGQGGSDGRILEGYPIVDWYPGEVVVDRRSVKADLPQGLYWLRLGVYQRLDEGAIDPLPLYLPDGSRLETVSLGPVLVGRAPVEVNRRVFNPQVPIHADLGSPPAIGLRGYDVVTTDQGLQLTLYWQSLAQTAVDWSTFVHVLDEQGAIVAQQDGPTGGGLLPTSLWQPGEIVADPVAVTLPPAAPDGLKEARPYTLVTGLYRPDTGGRLADNAIRLGPVEPAGQAP